jgi:hypothetical protein
MKKQSLEALIAKHNRAERQERQSLLRRKRRLVEIKLAARRKRTQVDIVLGADARKFGRGEMSLGAFQGRIEAAQKALAEIDQALAAVGLGNAELAQVGRGQSAPVEGAQPAADRKKIVTVAFWYKPSAVLRELLRPKCGLRYQPGEIVWRGRTDPQLVEATIREHGEWELVRFVG